MKVTLFAPITLPAALLLALPTPALANRLEHLVCAADISCTGLATNADEARLVLGIESRAAAEKAFVEASRSWPDSAWRCAASGDCPAHLSQNDAQLLIGLPEDAYARAQLSRRRAGIGTEDGGQQPERKPRPPGNRNPQRPGIVVETPRPGPREIILQPQPGRGDIQPQDGQWRFANGTTSTRGNCLAGMSHIAARIVPSPPQQGQVSFQRPFNPAQIIPAPEVQWRRTGVNAWYGVLRKTQGQPLEGGWRMRVVSPTRIEGESVITVKVPSQCTLSTPFHMQRQ